MYGQISLQQTAARASLTVLAAYLNDTQLASPPPRQFSLTFQHDAAAVLVSIPHIGTSFSGFSIVMSVISQVRMCPFFLLFVSIVPKLILKNQQWAKTRMCLSHRNKILGGIVLYHSLLPQLFYHPNIP